MSNWPATGPRCGSAVIRSAPEDFRVDEQLGMEPAGEGEHLWVQLRKRGENTAYVAGLLARLAGLPRRAVGYAGRKDRHAVTTQWFSLHLPGRPDPPGLAQLPPGLELLRAVRHRRKLQVGALKANRFELVLREVSAEREALERRLAEVAVRGVPNYFGTQRFGRDGGNVEAARAWFRGERRVRERDRRSLLLSAARAQLFNAVLAERVWRGCWDRLLTGDVMILDGRRSFFAAAPDDAALQDRLAAGEVHPSGPLWGRGGPVVTDDAAALESAVIGREPLLARGLEEAGVEAGRRALRVIPRGLSWGWLDASTLRLSFTLPAGSYATAVLAELLDCRDGAGPAPPASV